MGIYDEPTNFEEVTQKRRALRKQRTDINEQACLSAYITCPCGRRAPIKLMYRCWFCGLTLCNKCAKVHFGDNPPMVDIGLLKGEIR